MREGLHSKLRTLLTLLFYHHVLPLVYNIFTYVFVNSFSPHWEIIADHVTTIPSPSQVCIQLQSLLEELYNYRANNYASPDLHCE